MKHVHLCAPRVRQQGITLIVGMIMLVLSTLIVLATFHLGKSNLEIVGNVQYRIEALGTAQQTIETAISSPLLTTNPTSIFPNPCQGPNTLCFDVNDDGNSDMLVTLTPSPACVQANIIKSGSLDFEDPKDHPCVIQALQNLGVENASAGDSRCSYALWDIRAEAKDIGTGTSTTAVIDQGIGVRVRTLDVANHCP